MILLTGELRERLLNNGRDRGADHVPVVKFFNPLGEGVWLATELDADGDGRRCRCHLDGCSWPPDLLSGR